MTHRNLSLRFPVLFLASLALATLAARDAALGYWRAQDPQRVPVLLAGDPAIAVVRASQGLSGPGTLAAGAREAARAALRREPLQSEALRLLALAQPGPGEGMRLLSLAERLSRRDLQLELQLIDAAAPMGDAARVLVHYDHALSVHPEAGSRLLPVLARAASDETVGMALARQAGRPWFPGLLDAAIGEGTEPTALARLLAAARAHWPADRVDALLSRQLDRLVARGRLDAARSLAGQVPGMAPGALDPIGFSRTTTDPRLRPLSWTLAAGDDALAEPGDDGSLAIRLDAERTALVAGRVTLLAGGSYAVMQTLAYAPGAPMARLAWRVECLAGMARLWQQTVPARAGRVTYRSTFTVPADCPAQRWRLTATAAEAGGASQARLERLALVALTGQ